MMQFENILSLIKKDEIIAEDDAETESPESEEIKEAVSVTETQ